MQAWQDGGGMAREDRFDGWSGADYASGAGRRATAPNEGRSQRRLQLENWDRIQQLLLGWGISRRTLREDQAQIVRRGRRWVQANNQPDVAALTPDRQSTINVEADHTGKRQNLKRALLRIHRTDPTARVAGVLYRPRDGRPVETWFWNHQTGRLESHTGGLRRSDVLPFEESDTDEAALDALAALGAPSAAMGRPFAPLLA